LIFTLLRWSLAGPARLAAAARLKRYLPIVASLAVLVGGCEEPQRVRPRSTNTRASADSDLDIGLDFLKRLDEFEKQQAGRQATGHLNRWIGEQAVPEGWQPDDLVRTLPRVVREGPAIGKLSNQQSELSKVDDLIEVVWMNSIARWVSGQPAVSPLADIVARQAKKLETTASEQLILSDRLFDWTIRNVQLDVLLDYPADQVAVNQAGENAPNRHLGPPAARLLPGPGYQLQPWQVLLYGHGDSLARARVFILLARQHNIPVVMLAFPGLTTPPRPRPWVAAALIDQQLYLFDTQLGLPIPGPGENAVATLEDVLDDPKLLSSLGVGEEFSYRIPSRDLKSIQALIDASASSLSLRFKLIEDQLTGDNRMRLTVAPTQIAEQLKKCRGIEEVALWSLPYEADWYREAMLRAIDNEPRVAAQHYVKYGVFETRTALVKGRYAHFRGQFDNVGDLNGAKVHYRDSRIPDSRIDMIATSPEVQRSFGVDRLPNENELAFQNRLSNISVMVMQTKAYASYWLGLAHYDTGNPQAATEWFKGRILDANQESPWAASARYNLGRAYEALGKIEEARNIYLADRSNQQHGNVVRARLLRRAIAAS
jgi:tetratricopeptide (TPR) repeat protein